MEINKPQTTALCNAVPQEEMERAARSLAERFAIDSAFVRVSTLARILGLAAPTIYAAMKAGRFPIPHRKVGTTPLVRLEDLARWYCEQDTPQPQNAVAPSPNAPQPSVIDDVAKGKLVSRVLRELRAENR